LSYVVTVTPSPAIDVSTSVARIAPFTKLRCASPQHDPGGGGINVARVVKRLGGVVTAIYPAGGTTGQRLRRLIKLERVPDLAITAMEETREDFTVFEETTSRQYRFVFPGARLSEPEWRQCLRALANVQPSPNFVVASGSLPLGVPDDFFGGVVRAAREMNAKTIVDTSGPPLRAALQEGVYLIKPNLREFQELTGVSSSDHLALVEASRRLIDKGLVELIALTLGADGALLIARDRALRADGLPIKPASVVGAGDSFVGAMTWSLAAGDSLDRAFRFGVAAGSAALLNPGTELCRSEDVQRLAAQVVVRPISGTDDAARID